MKGDRSTPGLPPWFHEAKGKKGYRTNHLKVFGEAFFKKLQETLPFEKRQTPEILCPSFTIAHDNAPLGNKTHGMQRGDIAGRISRDGHQIGQKAGADRAQPVIDMEDPRIA